VVRLEALPGLESPVAAVRGLARLDQPGERRSVIRAADTPASDAVADPELDLRDASVRRAGVDGARRDQRRSPSSAPVAHVRLALAVDRQSRPGDVAADDRAAERRSWDEGRDQEQGEDCEASHQVPYRPPNVSTVARNFRTGLVRREAPRY